VCWYDTAIVLYFADGCALFASSILLCYHVVMMASSDPRNSGAAHTTGSGVQQDTTSSSGTTGSGVFDDALTGAVQKAQNDDAQVLMLQAKIVELEEKVTVANDQEARAKAELANAKIRLEKEASDLRKFASEMTLRKLLPTIDNLQRALNHLPADLTENDWVKGIVALEQGFLKQVNELGLQKMDVLGQAFDATRHEVLLEGEGAAGTVIEVLEDGYELSGKVIRPAKVKVGRACY
jgi:molecular chaperone GrpE